MASNLEPSTTPDPTEPRLLGPLPLISGPAIVASSAVVLVAAALVAGWLTFRTSPDAVEETAATAATVIVIAAETVPGAVVPHDPSAVSRRSHVLAGMKLDDAEKERLLAEVADGKLRVGAISLWDTIDEDSDTVRIASGGFAQNVVIGKTPKMFYVPYRPGTAVRITAILDGGGGGVTLGVKTVIGPVPLPHLLVGSSVEIPVL